MNRALFALLGVTMMCSAAAAQTNPAALAARGWRQQHERAIVDEFIGLLALPNIARDRQDIQRMGTRTVIVPIGNHDNNQHSSDENLRIQNL